MHPTRLRSGEIVAGVGAAALLVTLFLRWYGPPAGASGWGSVGWLVLVPLVIAIALGLALVVTTLTERTPAWPLGVGVTTVPWALLAALAIIVRLIAEPGPDAEVSVRWPAWAALAGALLVLAGAWRALADERTDTAEARAQTERALAVRGEPRRVPPPGGGSP